MNHAVALVQAYLHVNGYFTVAEYPVLEALREGGYRTATDIDLLALRLCEARWLTVEAGRERLPRVDADPVLAVPTGSADFLIIEVKEGRAVLNRGAKSATVLTSALGRFGMTRHPDLDRALGELEQDGKAQWPDGTWVRMLAFGSVIDPALVSGFQAIPLGHVAGYLKAYVRDHWSAIRHAQLRHPALGFVALLEQLRQAETEPER